ncbi:MAG: sensor histidine kinase [Oscillospiraceae bacterium]
MFLSFLKSRVKEIVLWAIISVIFAVVMWCYQIPLRAVIYAAGLSLFFLLVAGVVDFVRFSRLHSTLRKLEDEILFTVDNLPDTSDAILNEYSELVRILSEENRRLRSESEKAFTDMTDYYTLWAHQIKTPIAAMELVLQQNDGEEFRELHDNLAKIEHYVEMVLCYLRVNSDSSDLLIKEYSLDKIVRCAVRKYSRMFIRKKLSLDYEPLDVTVLTDEKWLQFVIEQVLSNAIKYTPSGGIRIYLEAPTTLCIEDTGIGISPEDLPTIFEKGSTGLNGRLDKKASGMGLYLCRKICGRLGHKIIAESSNGTTIKIDLSTKKIGIE